MKPTTLGTIRHLRLKDVFPKEAMDFTPYLCEHINILCKATGLEIVNPVREERQENFIVDIVAELKGDNNATVIIENQYGDSNHDHLGKLITYSATKSAAVAIWICETAREEHIAAIRMLNELNDSSCKYFLLEAKVLQIDDSAPAITFEAMTEAPTIELTKSDTPAQRTLRAFWLQFRSRCKELGLSMFANRSVGADHWIDGSVGVNGLCLTIAISKDHYFVKLGFWNKDAAINKRMFDDCHANYKEIIEKEFGEPLVWLRSDNRLSSFVRYECWDMGYSCPQDEWDEMIDAIIKNIQRFHIAITPYLNSIR